jgi:hypothetical protein
MNDEIGRKAILEGLDANRCGGSDCGGDCIYGNAGRGGDQYA